MKLAIQKDFYGDNIRWFVGIVEQVAGDPLTLGRIKVRIHGIHTADNSSNGVPLEDLPWANVVLPVTQGGTSETTQPTGIQVGAQVFGIFADGEQSQSPIVLGSIPHNPGYKVATKHSNPDENYTPESIDVIQQKTTHTPDGPGYESSTPASVIPMVGGSNIEKAYNFLKVYFETTGYQNPAICAAGFCGNLLAESRQGNDIEPIDLVGDNGHAFGIAQWQDTRASGNRFGGLVKFAKQNGTEWNRRADAIGIQLRFIVAELEAKSPSTPTSGTFKRCVEGLRKAENITDATRAVMDHYEMPNAAVQYYKLYQFGSTAYQRPQNLAAKNYQKYLSQRVGNALGVLKTYGGD